MEAHQYQKKLQLKMQKGNIKLNINFYVIKTFSPQFQEFYKIVQKTTHAFKKMQAEKKKYWIKRLIC